MYVKLIDEKSTVSIMTHPEWFTSELKEVNNEQGTAELVVRVLENDSPDERTCELVVVAGSGVRQAKDTILIEQAGKEIPSKVVLSRTLFLLFPMPDRLLPSVLLCSENGGLKWLFWTVMQPGSNRS